MPLPMSTMARDRIPASTLARVGAERRAQPDFARPPRDADGHQREDAQRRQKQDERGHRRLCSGRTIRPISRCRTHSSSGCASWTNNPPSTLAAMNGRRAASVAGLPRTRTLITSGDTVPADAA